MSKDTKVNLEPQEPMVVETQMSAEESASVPPENIDRPGFGTTGN